MGITIKTPEEIVLLREGGRRLGVILGQVAVAAIPGVSTLHLDRLAESLIFDAGGVPSFKGYRVEGAPTPYPASICASINSEVVHAIPDERRILKDGDIVSIDIGMWWPVEEKKNRRPGNKRPPEALVTDMALTVGIGRISSSASRLIRGTRESLEAGIASVRAGGTVGDIGHAVGSCLRGHGFGVIRDLAGHGVGYALHEDPFIPNFGTVGSGPLLKEGMIIAIEPMATLGDWHVVLEDNDWAFSTADGSLAAHFEQTIAVTKDGGEVLTPYA